MSKIATSSTAAPPPLAVSTTYTATPFRSRVAQHGSTWCIAECAAVIDIEALVMANFVLVEQIGFVVINCAGVELFGKNFYIEQPLGFQELLERHPVGDEALRAAIAGYEMVTGDPYVHPKTHVTYTWRNACMELKDIVEQYKPVVWAKGAGLERRVFGKDFIINELEEVGCPKYPPGRLHDPLAECRFFSQYVPRV